MKDIIPKPKKSIIKKKPAPEQAASPQTEAPKKSNISESLQVTWQAPEYEYYPKNTDWFWSVIIITAASFAASIIFLQNFLFSVFIILAGFVILLYGAKKPRLISFSVTARGIAIGKNLYPYEDLKSFWIHYNPPYKKELAVKSKRMLIPMISIPLNETDPNAVRALLVKFLKEERQEESLIDAISNYLRF